jgi:hypothetical protein
MGRHKALPDIGFFTALPLPHPLKGQYPEVGKMKIVYLLPLSLPSTRHVGDIVYLKKR